MQQHRLRETVSCSKKFISTCGICCYPYQKTASNSHPHIAKKHRQCISQYSPKENSYYNRPKTGNKLKYFTFCYWMCNWFLKRKKQSISKNSEQQQKSSLYHQSLYNRIDSLFYLIQSLNFGTVACNFLHISICTKNSSQYRKRRLYPVLV